MLHFEPAEYAARQAALDTAIAAAGFDALLMFAPESQYWLTGHDTFGYCFFQCLVAVPGRAPVLLTRSADLRQAQLTSTIADIRIWKDAADADPGRDLAALLAGLGLPATARLGVETDTHGLTAQNWLRLAAALPQARLEPASGLVSALRLVKSPAEIACVRRAAELGDAAYEAALPLIRPGADEAAILAALQGEIFARGGDYPANEVIIGSDAHALLCRYASGRRTLGADDQLTLEWAGVWRHYHAALMRTVVVGRPRPRHVELHAAAEEALLACEAALRPGAVMGDVFAAHAATLDARGLSSHRLNACGYALGARFSPSWMEREMFYEAAPAAIVPGQVFFLHMILMDSDSGTAMTLGRTSLVTEAGADPLSRLPLALDVV
ncbi:Xaa-Pro peptidase family protein [Oceanicella sp. SM1341]|uniref:M24 family metallopeptidase n=1 Tax=Oceanicella sp. SM1341 TaxID=1548889 RepID=UPI000E5149AD|nr:Xaa-Pro peptidase family protein [Oceanicella sp. SM1341]